MKRARVASISRRVAAVSLTTRSRSGFGCTAGAGGGDGSAPARAAGVKSRPPGSRTTLATAAAVTSVEPATHPRRRRARGEAGSTVMLRR
jgi:hypothetical protein